MKAVLQAGWLLTVAVGNIIVLIVAEAATLPDKVGGLRPLLVGEINKFHQRLLKCFDLLVLYKAVK